MSARAGRLRPLLSFTVRAAVTLLALWWIFRSVDLGALARGVREADRGWMIASIGIFFLAQFACIVRWALLVPSHPAVRWPFLTRSFFVASFFNTLLPTTVGGDVIRSYDLIRATGQWRSALASVLMDRLVGFFGFILFALAAWMALPAAREDPVIRSSFFAFLAVVAVTFSVLCSRRMWNGMLRPFSRIGLGALGSHAKQFQESLLEYFKRPGQLAAAFVVSLGVQLLAILVFAAVSSALRLPIPFLFMMLMVPLLITISQLPISLNGLGIREGAAVILLQRIQVPAEQALALSLICAAIPITSAIIGAFLFLTRRKKKR